MLSDPPLVAVREVNPATRGPRPGHASPEPLWKPPRGTCPAALTRLGRDGNAPVAQLDRALDYESRGQEFESLRARQLS